MPVLNPPVELPSCEHCSLSPALLFQALIPWRLTTSSCEASTWSSSPKRSPRAPPTSSSGSAGVYSPPPRACWSVKVLKFVFVTNNFMWVSLFGRSPGTIHLSGWEIRRMEWRTFRNTSTAGKLLWKKMIFFLSFLLLWLCWTQRCHGNVFSLSFRWFEGFNWDGLCQGTMESPFTPAVRLRRHHTVGTNSNTALRHKWQTNILHSITQVSGPLDNSNFDYFPEDAEDPPPDEEPGWDLEF